MAPTSAQDPAQSGARCRDFDTTPEFPRNRQGEALSRDGAASLRAPRGPTPRAQHASGRGGLCSDIRSAQARRPRAQARACAVDQVVRGHEPYPALAIDRAWTMVSANRAVAPLLAGLPASLLKAPVNVLRLSLH